MISLAKFPSFLVVIKKMTAPVERMTGDMDQEDPLYLIAHTNNVVRFPSGRS